MSPRALKACPHCGDPTPKTPCVNCRRKRDRARSAQYRADVDVARLDRLKAKAKKRQPWCAWPGGCQYPITTSNPLSVDHMRSIDAAPELCYSPENLIVLCLSHNKEKATKSMMPNGKLIQEPSSPFTPRDLTPPTDRTLYLPQRATGLDQ